MIVFYLSPVKSLNHLISDEKEDKRIIFNYILRTKTGAIRKQGKANNLKKDETFLLKYIAVLN